MSVLNLKSSQRGAFAVEFSIVAAVFALILLFSGDIVMKLSIKGKLDRLTYSLVNVMKERTQLYGESEAISQAQAQVLNDIARGSLSRTIGNFDPARYGILVEEQGFNGVGLNQAKPLNRYQFGTQECQVKQGLDSLKSMSVVSSWGRQVPLYRITLCYQSPNWIGSLMGKEYKSVASDAILIGR